MLHDNVPVAAVTLVAQIPTGAQTHSLIHAQMDAPAAEGVAEMGNHGFHQSDCSFLTNHQIVHRVPHGCHILPPDRRTQMSKGLNAGYQFDAQHIRKIIHFLLFCNRVPATAVAEIRVSRKFVSVLHIQIDGIESHQRKLAQEPLHGFHGIYTVSGQVDHGRQSGKPRR